MIIPCTKGIHLKYLGFMAVYLDKEPARFDSTFRDILDEREEICHSKGFMQGKRRKKIQRSII